MNHIPLRVLLTIALATCVSSARATPVENLRGGLTGRIEYQSITPPNRWEYLRAVKQNTKDVTVYGDLLMPKMMTGTKVPAVVLSHGSGGVNPALFDVWAKELNAAGYAVFIIDSFKPRGIDSTVAEQTQIDISAGIADAYNALKLLATHPQIDARRIALVGFSRGGQVTYEAYFDAARKPVVKDDLKFAAFIPVYQGGCTVRIRSDRGNTNNVPLLALLGGKDDSVGDPQNCIDMFKDVNANAHANITWKVYGSAYHGFDGFSPYRFDGNAQTDRACSLEVDVLAATSGLGAARNFKTGVVVNGWNEWNVARKECKTTGHAVSGDASVRAEAVKDALAFLQGMTSPSIGSESRQTPATVWQGPESGRIEFDSITPPDRWQFVRKVMENTKPAKVYGDLLMPRNVNGKVPAVLISHDSGGVTAKLYDVWAKELNNAGVAVFIIDSFKPRGIDSTTNNQGQVDVSANVADALYGLKLLATHPQIDAKRIFHMGGSRGGTAVFETYWDMVRKAVITDDLKFAGHIPLYQGNCNTRFRFDRGNTNKAPMLAFMGGADDGTPADACVAYYTELNRAGANIKWKVLPGAFHNFDGSTQQTYLAQGVTAKNCSIEVFLTDVKGGGLGEARDYKSGANINGFGEWNEAFASCNSRGFTVGSNSAAKDQAVKDLIVFVMGK